MIFDPDSSILVVFCRRPAPGVGKQRIAAELGETAAYEVAELLLAATLEDAAAWPGAVVIAPATAEDAAWAAEILPAATVISQGCGNLGTRIQGVQAQIRSQGGRRIIFIGSDSPGLTPQLMHTAFAQLEQTDTVFIPARDGGVTLMGSRLPWPDLAGLPWGSGDLGIALQECCQKAGLSISTMATGFDIDTRQDLVDAIELLAADLRPARVKLREWIIASGLGADTSATREPRVSVIIPVFDDLAALEVLLHRLGDLQPGADEVIVVDGNNSEDCRRLCSHFAVVYIASRPNRGAQLGLGATHASGDILWFLHADSCPSARSVTQIRNHVAAGNSSGYFRFRFDGVQHWYKRWLASAINLRARFGIPYGDQGLFVERTAYARAGGHTATPLFEEVALIKHLRREQGCAPLAASIGVASRRWERDGWLRRSLHNRYLAAAFALGIAPERLARQYGHRHIAPDDADSH
jgi:rSAM/selenodomain-associated transferase 2/rSAM/selenodomain-associated transferase 1